MFQFNFDVDEGDVGATWVEHTLPAEQPGASPSVNQTGEPFSEISLDSLLNTLPTQISYAFLSAQSSDDGNALKIARRDLFDARFQLISEGTDPETILDQGSESSIGSALQFIDNPSDLVPLVYEGGLKTWECSLDLASCLKTGGYISNVRGARVLELGCGTAIPTLHILHEIFSSQPASDTVQETHIHLQDYNTSVLQLVTIPNVLLAWCKRPLPESHTSFPHPSSDTSPAAELYRNSSEPQESEESELHIAPELVNAFRKSLQDYKINLRFFSGSWETFDLSHTEGRYDLVLSSETIYHPQSLPGLVRVMRGACSSPADETRQYHCLVAAKTVYFGVGGGVAEFIRCVEGMADERGRRGQVEIVWEKPTGVSRRVMSVKWA